jgi:hypothetical protein
MQLNLEQFLNELLDAECSMSVSAGVVTFEDGDTFDVAVHLPRPAAAKVTPVDNALALAALQGDEAAIVDAFRPLLQSERNQLGAALSSFYSVLCMESKFQPNLLVEPIKIAVTSFDEGLAVQRALFQLGCGFHHGGYPLSKDLANECTLSGIFVSRKGVMTVMPLREPGSLEYVANSNNRAVSPAAVLSATTIAELLAAPV